MADYRYEGAQPAELEGQLVHPGDVWEFAQPPDSPPWFPVSPAPETAVPATPAAATAPQAPAETPEETGK